MKSQILLFCLVASALAYEPTWESLDTRPLPQWYNDANIGTVSSFTGVCSQFRLSSQRGFGTTGKRAKRSTISKSTLISFTKPKNRGLPVPTTRTCISFHIGVVQSFVSPRCQKQYDEPGVYRYENHAGTL